MSNRLMAFGGLGVALLWLLMSAVYTVHQTEQALVVQFGRPMRIVQEPGLQFKKPFVEDVVFFDQRLLDFLAEPKEITLGDKKRLMVDAFVRYRITDPLKFYQTVRDERIMRDRLNSIVESSLRQVMGSQTIAKVLSSERANIMKTITLLVNAQTSGKPLSEEARQALADDKQSALTEDSAGFGVEVVDVRIMRADLPQENSEGIFRRMQTEREREAKELRAKGEEQALKIRAKAENERSAILANAQKEADIVRGEGDANATRIFAESFGRDPEFFAFYRSLQAYKNVMNSKDTTMVLSPGSEFLKYMDKK